MTRPHLHRTDLPQDRGQLQALLIGIDHHPKVPRIDLQGAVADVRAMRRALKRRGVQEADMRCLISPHPKASSLQAASSSLPTYRHMIREIRRLGRRAAARGQHALLYFSGHGSRVPSLLKPWKETDECLVPCDVGEPGVRWLRDVELTYLLDEMLAAGLEVTCIIDACHGAGVMRHEQGLRIRRVRPGNDLGSPASSSDLGAVEVLRSRWQSIHRRRTEKVTRSSIVDTGWLARSTLHGGGLTFLAACRQREEALEFPLDGAFRGGMTYYLVQMLEASVEARGTRSDPCWRQVHGRLTDELKQLAESHSVPPQHPILEGSQRGHLFPSSAMPRNRILVKSVRGRRLLLGAGVALGLRHGALLSTMPYGNERGVRWVQVTDVAAEEAWAEFLDPKGSGSAAVGEGLRCVRFDGEARHGVGLQLKPSAQRPRGGRKRRVLRNGQPVAPPVAADDRIVSWLKTALESVEMGAPQWRVQVRDGRCQVQPPFSSGLATLPTVPIHDVSNVRHVVDQLRHLDLWQHFWNLGPNTDGPSMLTLQIAHPRGSLAPDAPLQPGPLLTEPLHCKRDQLHLLGLTLIGSQPMHFAILALGDDGSMTWLHPETGSGEELEPGRRLWLRWIGRRPGRQRLKVIATAAPMAVSTWSLPPVEAALTSPEAVVGYDPERAPMRRAGLGQALSSSERFYFNEAHRFWTRAHLDVQVT